MPTWIVTITYKNGTTHQWTKFSEVAAQHMRKMAETKGAVVTISQR